MEKAAVKKTSWACSLEDRVSLAPTPEPGLDERYACSFLSTNVCPNAAPATAPMGPPKANPIVPPTILPNQLIYLPFKNNF